MVNNNWFQYLESLVSARIQDRFPQVLKIKYPNLNFTTSDEERKEPTFPTVKIHLMPMSEVGEDLEGLTINGVLATFQIDVTTNQSKTEVMEVANAVATVMKTMRFTIITFPESTKQNEVYRAVFRARRTIGAGDNL